MTTTAKTLGRLRLNRVGSGWKKRVRWGVLGKTGIHRKWIRVFLVQNYKTSRKLEKKMEDSLRSIPFVCFWAFRRDMRTIPGVKSCFGISIKCLLFKKNMRALISRSTFPCSCCMMSAAHPSDISTVALDKVLRNMACGTVDSKNTNNKNSKLQLANKLGTHLLVGVFSFKPFH